MGEYVLTLLAAAAVTYLLTPAVRRFAIAVGASHAARDRDVHKVPTPLLGGFAMYAGLAAGLLVASRIPALTGAFAEPNMSKGLLLAGGLVVVMGFVDDRWGLGALSKLAGQVAAGVILVWSGAEVTWLPLPGGGVLGLTTDQQTAATLLVVVITINAVNFIDGLDGLAAGIVGIGAAAFFIYYYTLTHRLGLPDQTGPALASAVLVGICVGFLPHNFYPARIFMGDTGAMLLGLLLAYAPISSLASLDPASLTDKTALAAGTVNRFGAILPLLVPAAIMLIPYADLLMAVIRRTRAGTSVFSPDKKHLQHRLLAIGHSHRTSVLIMYLWAALFAGSVVWLSIARTSLYILIIVTGAAVLALALLLVSMPRLRPWARAASAASAARQDAARAVPRAVPSAARVVPAAVTVMPAAARTVPDAARRVPGEDAAEPRPAYSPARQQDPVTRQAAGTAAGNGAPSPPAWAEPTAAPPAAARPASADFPPLQTRTPPVPADPDATGPIPAMPGPPADVPAAPSPLNPVPVSGRSPASPFRSDELPAQTPSPFRAGPVPGNSAAPPPRPDPGAEVPSAPPPAVSSGAAAGEPSEPPFEQAPWPGFAAEEPAGPPPEAESAPEASSRRSPEPASWFEPTRRPGQRNGSAQQGGPAAQQNGSAAQQNGSAAQQNGSAAPQNGSSAGPEADAASWFEPAAPSYRPNGPGAD
jgi:UDP-GlcNAc:undecaprenyl-phosphate/decaprenyl-phosphate GlcNAc-1-phosphate transferase